MVSKNTQNQQSFVNRFTQNKDKWKRVALTALALTTIAPTVTKVAEMSQQGTPTSIESSTLKHDNATILSSTTNPNIKAVIHQLPDQKSYEVAVIGDTHDHKSFKEITDISAQKAFQNNMSLKAGEHLNDKLAYMDVSSQSGIKNHIIAMNHDTSNKLDDAVIHIHKLSTADMKEQGVNQVSPYEAAQRIAYKTSELSRTQIDNEHDMNTPHMSFDEYKQRDTRSLESIQQETHNEARLTNISSASYSM